VEQDRSADTNSLEFFLSQTVPVSTKMAEDCRLDDLLLSQLPNAPVDQRLSRLRAIVGPRRNPRPGRKDTHEITLEPALEGFLTPLIRRLLYNPSSCCPLGHKEVEPFRTYPTAYGDVQMFKCKVCGRIYPELDKPKQKFEIAFLLAHYFGHASLRTYPTVLNVIEKAVLRSLGSVRKLPTPSVSTEKRLVRKYAKRTSYLTVDDMVRTFRLRLSGYFAFDALNVATVAGKRAWFLAEDLRFGGLVSTFLPSAVQPHENFENWRWFLRRFRSLVDSTGHKIRQALMDDRKEGWRALELELPRESVKTPDGFHFFNDIDEEKLPRTFRSPKAEAMLSEIEFAIFYSKSKEQAQRVIDHVLQSKEHWLAGEGKRVQQGVNETLNSLNERNVKRLLTHWDLVKPGSRIHFRSTSRTESRIRTVRTITDPINCFQSVDLLPGQLNLIALIVDLMPNSRDGKSAFQRHGLNMTILDLDRILQAFDPNSPIQ